VTLEREFTACENRKTVKQSFMETTSPLNHEEVASSLERDGFALVRSCLNELAVKRLCESLDDTQYGQRNLLREPVIQELARSREVRGLVASVLGPNCFAVKGILFNKTQKSNWKVPWHQDLTITVQNSIEVQGFGPWTIKGGVVNVQPREDVLRGILAIRIHLDANDHQNGPLRVIPGSHKYGRLTAEQIAKWDKSEAAASLVPRGGALLMRPLLLHASSACQLPKSRRVIHLEYCSDDLPCGLQWHTKV
jgi:ectoine hydroxylase-related dioxygenase (phytanoyl-CoA dioxygenase family)